MINSQDLKQENAGEFSFLMQHTVHINVYMCVCVCVCSPQAITPPQIST